MMRRIFRGRSVDSGTPDCCRDCRCGGCPGCPDSVALAGTVGVSPGTYTLQLGAPTCPPDPPNNNSWDLYYGPHAVPMDRPLYAGYMPTYDPSTLPLNGPPTVGGVRLDILGGVAVLAAGAVFVLSMLAK